MTNQKPWIKCPDCGSPTILYIYPDDQAGTWVCTNDKCGASDVCEHENVHNETTEVDTMRNGEHDTYEALIEVCDDCECGTGNEPAEYEPDDREDDDY